jgi:hypothetical protein
LDAFLELLPESLSTDIQTKICEWCEGSEASIEEPYQFGEHKSTNLRGEVDGNLINNNQKEGHTHCQMPSQHSQPSHTLVSMSYSVCQCVERSYHFGIETKVDGYMGQTIQKRSLNTNSVYRRPL